MVEYVSDCLSARGVYEDASKKSRQGTVIDLIYDKTSRAVDISPFFDEGFDARDGLFGNPDGKRREENHRTITYRCTFFELCETFLGTYRPDEFAEFLESNSGGNYLVEALAHRVRTLYDHNRVASIVSMERPVGNGLFKRVGISASIIPLNFDLEEANDIMDRLPKKAMYSKSAEIVVPRLFQVQRRRYQGLKHFNKDFLPRVREIALGMDDPVIILIPDNCVNLDLSDDFEFVKGFDINTGGLRIIGKQ